MKSELKSIIENLNPKLLGVDRISVNSFRKIGVGECNVNYLIKINDKKFICRVRFSGMPNKSKYEFDVLKKIQSLNIVPKPYYYHPKDKTFPYEFVILEFMEGKPLPSNKRTYTKDQIKQIACILAELHSKKCNGFPKKNFSFHHYITESKSYTKSINKYNNKLESELEVLHKRIRDFLPKKEDHKFSLIHGDVCPKNIVEAKGGLKLIDWETLQCSDPARDIANILIDLEWKDKNLDLFLKKYYKIRKDPTILDRAKVYAILMRYMYVLWEIVRVFEIINKKFPKEYLKKTTAQSHINEAKFQFRKLGKLIDVPKINIDVLFAGAKN